MIPGVSADGARHVAGTMVLVRGEHVLIVADPGMVTDRALLGDTLAKEGIAPHEVTLVFVSHHHPDHTVKVALFSHAEVVDFWAVYKGDLWRDHVDGYAMAPGINVLHTPGHTEEDASLVVETAEGTYVLTHRWWLDDMTLETDPIAWKQEALDASSQKVVAIADGIIPGHGTAFRNPRKG